MLNPRHLREYIVKPTLLAMGAHSKDAENLLCGTALVESNLIDLVQLPSGYARSLWQIEPPTYADLRIRLQKEKRIIYNNLLDFLKMVELPVFTGYLTGNLYAACAFARIKYLFDPNPIPKTITEQSRYWAEVYNSRPTIEKQMRYVERYYRAYPPA